MDWSYQLVILSAECGLNSGTWLFLKLEKLLVHMVIWVFFKSLQGNRVFENVEELMDYTCLLTCEDSFVPTLLKHLKSHCEIIYNHRLEIYWFLSIENILKIT